VASQQGRRESNCPTPKFWPVNKFFPGNIIFQKYKNWGKKSPILEKGWRKIKLLNTHNLVC